MKYEEELLAEYGYDAPILLEALYGDDRSETSVRKALTRMTERGVLARFSAGVYYFPKITTLGQTLLDVREVCERKYVRNGDDVFGYYSGVTFENLIGMSKQMPNIMEVTSNNASARVREIEMGGQRVRLRRSRTTVTKQNAKVLPLLDLLNTKSVENVKMKKRMILKYMNDEGITRDDVMKAAVVYPARASKCLIESGLINAVA